MDNLESVSIVYRAFNLIIQNFLGLLDCSVKNLPKMGCYAEFQMNTTGPRATEPRQPLALPSSDLSFYPRGNSRTTSVPPYEFVAM